MDIMKPSETKISFMDFSTA